MVNNFFFRLFLFFFEFLPYIQRLSAIIGAANCCPAFIISPLRTSVVAGVVGNIIYYRDSADCDSIVQYKSKESIKRLLFFL